MLGYTLSSSSRIARRIPRSAAVQLLPPKLMLAACVALIGLVTASPALAQSVAEFYRGKQITLMVGSSPGGGYDAMARIIASHIGKLIPGNPGIIVQNAPGGGSVTMSNRIYRIAPQDGTVLGLVQRGVLLAQLTKRSGVQFEIAKFNWIGSVSPDASFVVAWHTAPIKTVQDLLAQPMIVGGTGATSDLEASARLLNATIGTKFRIVGGYPGQADVLLAIQRGELQGSADWAWSEIKSRYASLLTEKKINLILQHGLSKVPEVKDVPLTMDLIKNETDRKVAALYFGLKQVARPILAGPGVPADRLVALGTAFLALKEDPGFKADADKLGLSDPTPAGEIENYIKLTTSASPEVVRRITTVLNPSE